MKLLWLLQLSDSALPVGAMNQSFGLENVVAEESLNNDQLESCFRLPAFASTGPEPGNTDALGVKASAGSAGKRDY